MTAFAAGRRPLASLVALAERRGERVAVAILGMLMAVAAVVLYRKGLGTTFYYDEWSFVIDRRDWDLDAFLKPHNEHIALLPVAIYKLLFVTVGLDDYGVYRVVAIGFHLLCVGLLFALLRRRVGDWLALVGAALILFLGSAWDDLIWPFQIGFVGSVAAGLGMFLALDRRDRAGDVSASVLLAVSLASSSIGLPFVAAAIVEVLLRRRRLGALWIPLVPLALWGVWYVAYGREGALQGTTLGTFGLLRQNLPVAPAYVADMVASGFGALLGLGLEWGRPLALAGLAILLLRLGRDGPLPARLAGLLALGVTYWGLTAAFRAHLMGGNATRYMYLTAILILLIGAELLRGTRVPTRALAILGVFVAFAALANFAKLREGSVHLQDWSSYVAAELAAVELAADHVAPTYQPDPVRAPPVLAGPYLDAVHDLGSPADTPDEVLRRPEAVRQAADVVLIQALRIGPFSARPFELGPPPQVTAAEGQAERFGPCVAFRPNQAPASVEVEAASDVVVRLTGTTAAEYRLRSFADTYPTVPNGTLEAGSTKTLPLGRGDLPRPWRLRVTAHARVDICSAA